MIKHILASIAFVTLTASAAAAADGPGNFIAFQFTSGTADLAGEFGSGTAAAYDHSELGFKVEFWNMMAADYAFTASGGIGLFSENNKLGVNAAPGDVDLKYSQSSWNFRLGGDRVVKVGDRAILFFGPGIEYWSGSAKFEGFFPPGTFSADGTYETKNVTRISLSGRLGAHMLISESVGLTLQIGHKIGKANYEEAGAKTDWWPSSLDASCGLIFGFGGN